MIHTAELVRRSHLGSELIVCLSAVVVMAGCGTSSTVTIGPDPVKCQVSLAAPQMIDAGGGTGTLTVTTNPECAWTATSGALWISLSPSSGQGSASVELRATPNDGSAQRDTNIVVNGEQVRVSQRAPCRFAIAPATHSVDAAGGSGRVTISTSSDCAWTATSDVGWMSLAAPVAGSGNGAVTFTVAANSGNERAGSIFIGGQRSIVTQAAIVVTPPTPPAPSCTFSISPTALNVAAGGGTGSVAVATQSGCSWTASSSVSWIAVPSGSGGSGNGSVGFTVAANTGAARTGTLTIAGRAFTVTQATACIYTLSPREERLGANGGTASVSVSTTSACAWTATSNNSWLIIASGSSGTGNGQVTYNILPNLGGTRIGTLTVAGQSFRVEQAGNPSLDVHR